MKIHRFMTICQQLLKAGWKARINPETGRGIQLKQPHGRKFCFDPFMAVYSYVSGKTCYSSQMALSNIQIEEQDGVYREEIWAAMQGSSSGEGMEECCHKLYRDMLKKFDLPIPPH